MRIRPVTPADTAEWLRMRELLWPEVPQDHPLEVAAYFAEKRPELATFVIDREGGRLGGFVEASQRAYAEGCATSPVGYVEGWWVDEDLRRQGWGARLIAAAEGWARQQDLTEMASDCELDNQVSLAAHVALGYQEVERVICFRKTL
ncbi:MAG TPA: aminoglycoside 6'-N-acetyltransferase [Thermoanaerobaculia bacterium]|nr:aminoglycoside 6'-N-acetyltransferase [Thermoanaerobaculia bacterium]